MSCETFAWEFADFAPIIFNIKALTKDQVIEKLQKALRVCALANIVINRQNDIIMKYTEKIL